MRQQITYFNETKEDVYLFAADYEEFIGAVGKGAFVTFSIEVPKGHGLFFKHIQTGLISVGTTELQTKPPEEEKVDLGKLTPSYYEDFMGGGEP